MPVTRPATISLFLKARLSPSQSRGRGPTTRDKCRQTFAVEARDCHIEGVADLDAEIPLASTQIGAGNHAFRLCSIVNQDIVIRHTNHSSAQGGPCWRLCLCPCLWTPARWIPRGDVWLAISNSLRISSNDFSFVSSFCSRRIVQHDRSSLRQSDRSMAQISRVRNLT